MFSPLGFPKWIRYTGPQQQPFPWAGNEVIFGFRQLSTQYEGFSVQRNNILLMGFYVVYFIYTCLFICIRMHPFFQFSWFLEKFAFLLYRIYFRLSFTMYVYFCFRILTILNGKRGWWRLTWHCLRHASHKKSKSGDKKIMKFYIPILF